MDSKRPNFLGNRKKIPVTLWMIQAVNIGVQASLKALS